MTIKQHTYADLLAVFSADRKSDKPVITAIRHFMRQPGFARNEEDILDSAWTGDGWNQATQKLSSSLTNRGMSKQSVRNVRHNLNVARRGAIELDAALQTDDPTRDIRAEFSVKVRMAREAAGMTKYRVAKKLGVHQSTYKGYETGRIPRNPKALIKLEKALGVDRGFLGNVSLVGEKQLATKIYTGDFGKRFADRSRKDSFKYGNSLNEIKAANPIFYGYWQKWKSFKSDEITTRPRTGRWGKSTSIMAEAAIRSFVGYMTSGLIIEELLPGGDIQKNVVRPPVSLCDIHILDIVIPDNITDYLTFIYLRNGTYATGVKYIRSFVAAALYANGGFFRSHWDLFFEDSVARKCSEYEPSEEDGKSEKVCRKKFEIAFNCWCEASRKAILNQTVQATSARPGMSRDPHQPIEAILDSPRPSDYLFRLCDGIRQSNRYHNGADKKEVATQHRDLAMCELMIYIPLRIRTLIRWLSWREDNTGTFRRDIDGSYQIILPPEAFKNIKGAARNGYKVAVPNYVADLIMDYVQNWRHVHITEDYVVVANRDIEKHEPTHGIRPPDPCDRLFCFGTPNGASDRICKLSCRHLGIIFRAHAYRHIVSTDYLIRNPENYFILACLLNDSLDVVIKTYAKRQEGITLLPYHKQLIDQREERRKA